MTTHITRWPHNWVFFLVCPVYLALVTEPHLLYTCFGFMLPHVPAIPISLDCLGEAFSQPAGLIRMITAWLSQCFCHAWAGAGVITVTALAVSELTRRHFRTAGLGNLPGLTCLPAVLIILIYSRYQHPLPGVLMICLGLAMAWGLIRALPKHTRLGVPLVGCATVLTFWVGGTGAVMVFVAVTGIHLLHRRKHGIALALGLPLAMAVIWILLTYLSLIPVIQAGALTLPLSKAVAGGMKAYSKGCMVALYCFVPVCLGVLLMGQWAWHRTHRQQTRQSRKARKKARTEKQPSKHVLVLIKTGVGLGLPFLLTGLALFFSHNPLSKPYVQMHHYSHFRQWDMVLETARQLPKGQTSVYVHHAIVRALFHTNRLPFDLLKYPQTPQGLFLTHETSVSNLTQLKLHDLFLELGQVNMAEKQASELLASDVEFGSIYERLAWIHIVKEHYDTARIFVNALHRDPLYRKTARTLMHILDHGLPKEQVQRIERIRACMLPPTETVRESLNQMLIQLLKHNPDNRMAFEYLMTLYCLTGQVNNVAALLPQSTRFDYPSPPPLYQEAAAIYYMTQKQGIDTKSIPIAPETLKRFKRFTQLRTAFQQRKQKALLRQLIEEFGSSYFFYYAFGQVGVK